MVAWVCLDTWNVRCLSIPALSAHLGNISFVLPNDIKSAKTLSVDFALPLGGSCFTASPLSGIEIAILDFYRFDLTD